MTSDLRSLHKAMDEVRVALSDLTAPSVRGQWRDDGTVSRHRAPSLLDQLRSQVGNSSGRGGAPGKTAPIPINADALDLLNTITWGTDDLVRLADVSPDVASVEGRLKAVAAAAGGWTDLEAVHGVRLALSGWVRAIRTLLDPPKRLYLAAPCPRCEQSMVWRRDESIGEDVQQPALQVDGIEGCTCLACGAHWPPQLFEHLASVLGCPPIDRGEPAA
jgi:hypothetical protein